VQPAAAPAEAPPDGSGDDFRQALPSSPRRREVPTREAPAGRAPEITPAWSRSPRSPLTLAVDVGGTGIKASVLDAEGRMVADRVRVPTRYPLTPDDFVDAIVQLARPMPSFDRVSVGFPGVVRQGRILTAPHFVTVKGPGSNISPELARAWKGYQAADVLGARLGRAVRIANDADMQGMAVVEGGGLELVVTLGTGVGTAVFLDGQLESHVELAHHPFRKGQTYNEQLGDATLQQIGPAKWRRRVVRALANFEILFNYDRCYLGGGNARRAVGHVDPSIVIVDNVAGILGGVRLWEHNDHHM
jgi:polyphosphate glucokinase